MQKFTDRYIKALQAKDQRYDINEGNGFTVRVFPSGSKSWLYVYRLDGRLRRLTLGQYPQMTLKEARKAHADASNLRHKNIDPGEKHVQAQKERREAPTIGDLAEEYIERHAKRNKRSWEEDQRMLNKDVLPLWRKRKAVSIKRRDVIDLLDGIVERGAPIVANRTFEVIRKMFNFAIERDIIEVSPCYMVSRPAQKQTRDRVLSDEEIRAFWRRLSLAGISPAIRLALKLQLVTAQRRGEIVTARWEDFDLDKGWWTIPAAISKNKLAHRVPLSPLATTLLHHLKRFSKGSEWLFPNPSQTNHVTENTPTRAIHRSREILSIDNFTPHDLRRTAASQMTSIGIPRLVVSKILNHAESGVTAVYDRHSYDREKREALDAWAKQLMKIVGAD